MSGQAGAENETASNANGELGSVPPQDQSSIGLTARPQSGTGQNQSGSAYRPATGTVSGAWRAAAQLTTGGNLST